MSNKFKRDIKKNKKDIFIQIRISQEEKVIIQKKAEEYGLSMSDFIRQLTFGYRIRKNVQQKEILRYIARIASNLNQIARRVNTFNNNINKLQLLTAILSIEKEIMEVRKCL